MSSDPSILDCCHCLVTKSCPTLFDPHGLQHIRLLCPPLSLRVCSHSCPWYSAISSSAVPSSFSLQSFPASGSLPVSRLFASGGQIIGVSASASVPPMNILDWFPLGLTGLISLQSKGDSLAWRTPWTVWKGKKVLLDPIGLIQEWESPCPLFLSFLLLPTLRSCSSSVDFWER